MSVAESPGVQPSAFGPRLSIAEVEEGRTLTPKFDGDGLIPVVTTDAASGEVLMMGVMNAEALLETIRTGQAHYWSRSRKCLWRKGASSGLIQNVIEARIDDDQDAVWLRVNVAGAGASCHVGYRSCFFRTVPMDQAEDRPFRLVYVETSKVFDPLLVYGDEPNPTQL
jgi:phosphoribosyl-AMP cyclohydrolase